MDEPEDKGYTVKDRRYLHLSEEEKARFKEEEAARKGAKPQEEAAGPAPGGAAAGGEVPLPEVTFTSFIFSLGSSAFVHLGAIPDPDTGEIKKNLPLAKQTIDLLGLLREKTRNNLTSEEENLFDPLLYDLRMKYIKEAG
jgi:hypothetical protein